MRSGDYGVPVTPDNRPVTPSAGRTAGALRVSAQEVPSLANPYFGVVVVTFENDSPAWVEVDRVAIDFGSPEKNASVQVPSGDDIATWGLAVEQRNQILYSPANLADVVIGFRAEEMLERASPFPATHLLSTPFRVPPGLFAKRWILLYTAARPAGGCIDRMFLDYRTADGRQARVALTFKVPYSPWQSSACPREGNPLG